MANEPHDVLLVLLREEPTLLDTLVEKVTGVRLPRGLKSSDATARFAKPAEVRLDLVLRSGRRRWAIIEIQRAIDPKKRRARSSSPTGCRARCGPRSSVRFFPC
jgi:hypothetical protein